MSNLPEIKKTENPAHREVESVFLPAFIDDNPIGLEKDPGYRDRLYSQGEKIAKAFLDGDWSVFAGQFLPEFSYKKHVCEPFEIPREWIRFRGYDWGFAAPAAMVWIARDPDTGRLYQYREMYVVGQNDPQQAETINGMTENWEKFSFNFGDPSVWTKRTIGVIARSTYDVFIEHGILLIKGDNDQIRKSKRLRTVLANIHDGEPGLKIFKTCENTIEELEGLMSDPDNIEKPLPNQADHIYDALCYALTNHNAPSITGRPKKKTVYRTPFSQVRGL